jgi:hypothetical protein
MYINDSQYNVFVPLSYLKCAFYYPHQRKFAFSAPF